MVAIPLALMGVRRPLASPAIRTVILRAVRTLKKNSDGRILALPT